MAAYCTRDDLTAVGVNANALRDVPGASVTSAIAMASDLIDSYLRVQFALPLASAGAELKRAAAIIAAYDLMSARGYNPNEPEDSPLRKRYEDVIAWLEKVAAGELVPELEESEDPETPAASTVVASPIIRTDLGRSISGYLDEFLPFQGRRR